MNLKGIYIQFSAEIDAKANREIHHFARALRQNIIEGISDIIPAYVNIYIEYDADLLSEADLKIWLEQNQNKPKAANEQRTITMPVNYNGQDLQYISQKTLLSKEEIISLHSSKRYQIYAIGFSPGFPFMAEIDEALRLPRRGVPRLEVPAGSVAIANSQTGIYPLKSPGGWHILGQALKAVYDPNRKKPFLLKAGDYLKFEASEAKEMPEIKTLELIPEPKRAFMRVLEAGLLSIFVDRGRFLMGQYGLSRSGAIDAKLANIANSLLGNSKNTVVLEINALGPKLEILSDILLSFAGFSMQMLVDGVEQESFNTLLLKKGNIVSFKTIRAAGPGYLAVIGGFASKRFAGSASVDLRAMIGRALRVDDILGGDGGDWARANRSFKPHFKEMQVTTLRLIKGPQYDVEIAKELSGKTFTVAKKDRVGIRFEGAKIPVGGIISEAAPIGALQISNDGTPILLLKDRGTIGGYSKPAILAAADFSKAAQLAVSKKVRFIF